MAKTIEAGDLVVVDLGDGCGATIGTVRAVSYQYSHLDGEEHTFVTVEPQDGDTFQLTLDELRAAERRAMFTPGHLQYEAFASMVGAPRG
ncbi:MAG: hypothetical protein AB7P11_21215 [Hydrogenophaga sp.]|uniref:hypothetical protein n=1 Tax=Hydrogenophaga sp. TaxID=1904254 RepID=UPI003D0A3F45